MADPYQRYECPDATESDGRTIFVERVSECDYAIKMTQSFPSGEQELQIQNRFQLTRLMEALSVVHREMTYDVQKASR